MGGKRRAFKPGWFTSYKWLEYSVQRDAAFCFVCRHFDVGTGRAEETFTKFGYRDWKHATGKGGVLQRHAKCITHLHAVSFWHTYTINKESGTSIANSLVH